MTLDYRKAQFLISAEKLTQCPEDAGFEVAFAGRSNAGKSSAINTLTDNKKLARTSKTPGRTQLINFFSLDEERRLVDLPGYGYAKVSNSVKTHWQALLGSYLENRKALKGIVLLMDIRHPIKPFDEMILNWAIGGSVRTHILLSKSDKVNQQTKQKTLNEVRKAYSIYQDLISVQTFSSLKKQGIDQVKSRLAEWLDIESNSSN